MSLLSRTCSLTLLLGTACQPDTEEHCVIALGEPLVAGDAPIERGWCPGVVPTVVIDEAAACPLDEVQEAVGFWAAHGHVLDVVLGVLPAEPQRRYAHIYLSEGDPGPGFDGMTGTINTSTKALEVASVVVRDCEPVVIAHELGHALGFGHSLHPDSVMFDPPTAWGLHDSELVALEEARSSSN